MSKLDKLLTRLRTKPPPADFTWDELCSVLQKLGYTKLNNSGSRRKFFHKERNLLISCHEPHPRPEVDKGCIVDVVDHLTVNGFIEDDNSEHS